MKMSAVFLMFLMTIAQEIHPQLSGAKKLIVTVTEGWNESTAMVYLFDRDNNSWKKRREEFSVSIGRSGLGWGIGLHPDQNGEFVKQEGDGRSPAGIFELDEVFYGLAPTAPDGVRYPYRRLTSMSMCVDDTASAAYNTIIEEGSIAKDWESAEEMGKIDPDYRYVLSVRHNSVQTKGKGSCIFFHINNIPTSGCTAMDEKDMLDLLHWLDPERRTLVVQLPHEEYHRLRQSWNLPKLSRD